MNFGICSGTNNYTTENDPTASRGVVLTPDAAAHTKGAKVELFSSIPFACGGFILGITNVSSVGASSNRWATSLYLGAAASEVEILPNIMFGGPALAAFRNIYNVYVPLYLPAGQRLSAAVQYNRTEQTTLRLHITLLSRAFTNGPVFEKVTNYGFDAANTKGVISNSGATANSLGNWVQIEASTARPTRALMLNMLHEGASGTSSSAIYQIGIGAAASEVIIVDGLIAQMESTSSPPSPSLMPAVPCNIRSGSRLAVRHQTNSNASTSLRETSCAILAFS